MPTEIRVPISSLPKSTRQIEKKSPIISETKRADLRDDGNSKAKRIRVSWPSEPEFLPRRSSRQNLSDAGHETARAQAGRMPSTNDGVSSSEVAVAMLDGQGGVSRWEEGGNGRDSSVAKAARPRCGSPGIKSTGTSSSTNVVKNHHFRLDQYKARARKGTSPFAQAGMIMQPTNDVPAQTLYSSTSPTNSEGKSRYAAPEKEDQPSLGGTGTKCKGSGSSKDVWQTRFEELQHYKQIHGDFNVPQKSGPLGVWVNKQRNEYSKFKAGKKSQLTQERIAQLHSINFTPATHYGQELWELRFNELKAFQEKVRFVTMLIRGVLTVFCLSVYSFSYFQNHHCNVKTKGSALGRWVTTQRSLYKQKKMPQEKKAKLNGIGFIWQRLGIDKE